MRAINTEQDIQALSDEGAFSEKVITHISDYFKRIRSVYGADYDPIASGCIVLLERGDPLNDPTFLEEKLSIRGGLNLVNLIKEFIDFDIDSNLFDVLVIFSADYSLTYLIPNETWVGVELLNHLQAFQNYQGNNSELCI